MSNNSKLLRLAKWGSISLVVIGLIVGGIGILYGGLDNVNFLFWK